MNYGDFKLMVAAAIQRSAGSLVVGDVDLLARAINLTRKQIERRRDFELAKDTADLTMTVGSETDLAGATYAGTETAISVKTILRASVSTDGGTSFKKVEVSNRAKHFLSVMRREEAYEGVAIEDTTDNLPTETYKFQLVQYADTVYLSPSDTDSYDGVSSVLVRMDVVRWLDEYE